MKRFLMIGILLLLLTGCGANSGETAETTEPVPVSTYIPNSAIEQETAGAIQLFQPELEYETLSFMGQKLLLKDKAGSLSVLSGSQGNLLATYEMGEQDAFYVAQTGVAYYRKSDNTVYTCNSILRDLGSYTMPEDISGVPVVNMAGKEIYYCVGKEILAMDMANGIYRLVKEFSNGTPQLTGGLFEGSVLICQLAGEKEEIHYISAKNGQTLSKDPGISHIQTSATNFYLERTDGVVPQLAYGTLDGASGELKVSGLTVRGIPEMNGAVSWQATDEGLSLSYYDLTTGKRTSALTLKGITEPASVGSDGTGVWFLTKLQGQQALLKWNTALSPVTDETVYTAPLYTESNPDTAGIAQCQKTVDSLNKSYGIRIRIWKDAVKVTDGYVLKPEYNTTAINGFLDTLSPILAQFPDRFLSRSLRSGYVYVCFVREIAGDQDYVLFHQDSHAYILISAKADVAEALYNAYGFLVDSYVLGNSRDYDDWNLLNPEGFVYGEKPSAMHLTESGRSFIDEQATKSPRDDRQRIFAYAMQADKANYFSTDTMQAKLRLVCSGIRESYGLEKKKEAFPWEQHLTTPIY